MDDPLSPRPAPRSRRRLQPPGRPRDQDRANASGCPSPTVNKATYEHAWASALSATSPPTKPTELAAVRPALDLFRRAAPRIPAARCSPLSPGLLARHWRTGIINQAAASNWQSDNAIDEHAPAGSPVVAIKPGVVVKLGGHRPTGGPVNDLRRARHGRGRRRDGLLRHRTWTGWCSPASVSLPANSSAASADWPHSDAMDHAHLGARGFNPEAIRNWPEVKLATSD